MNVWARFQCQLKLHVLFTFDWDLLQHTICEQLGKLQSLVCVWGGPYGVRPPVASYDLGEPVLMDDVELTTAKLQG